MLIWTIHLGKWLWIRRAANEIVVSWFTNYAEGFVLQTASDLGANNWSAVTNVPVVTNGGFSVNLNPTNRAAFYRLAR